MVDIALLGCGGGMPTPERFLSSLLINYKGRKILIDCGEGTQVSMKLLGWGFKAIDMICITHNHGDHIVGLPGLLATIGNSGRTEPILIVGPIGISDVVNGLRVASPYLPYDINIIENPTLPLKLKALSNGIILSKEEAYDVIISSLKLDHSTNCLGYSFDFKRKSKFDVESAKKYNIPKEFWSRLQNNETITYEDNTFTPGMVLSEDRPGIKISFITDTRPTDNIPFFINQSDLFICEGTYGNDNDKVKAIRNKHMTFSEAAQLALDGNASKLLLTHFSTAMKDPSLYKQNAESIFKNTIIGFDRLSMTLSYRE